MPKSSVPVLSAAELSDHDGDAVETVTVDRRRRGHQKVPPRSRLWGFVRSNDGGIDEAGGKRLDMTPQDIGLWLDERRCRFLIAANKKVIDDLAPIEFAQFVRKLRHSTTQVLFKYETRHDGTAGRPRCVWS